MNKNHHIAEAKAKLVWYMRLGSQGGWNFDWENQNEIEEIVDHIIAAVTAIIQEEVIKQHASNPTP